MWDAVGGFLFLFAHMQEKLSKNSTQVDLLQELLNLQKDLIVMLLSMLEGERDRFFLLVLLNLGTFRIDFATYLWYY